MTKEELAQFRSELGTVSSSDDAVFHRLIQRGFELGLFKDEDFGELLGVSQPTGRRWRGGISVPHPALRPVIFARLLKILDGVTAGDGPSHPREAGSTS